MSLLTSGQIEKLRGVIDRDGNFLPAADADKQQEISDRLGNQDGLTQIVYSTGSTNAEALDANAVPEGVTVLVEYAEGNAGNVYIGDSDTQQSALTAVGQGREMAVSDTSYIYVRTPTSGDRVVVTFEGGA